MGYSKKRFEVADILIKALTLILALVLFVEGTRTIREQYKSKYWDHQLKVYSRLLNSTGKLSTMSIDSLEFRIAKTEFLSIYYGEANLVSSRRVEARIIEIKNKLDHLESNPRLQVMYQSEIRELSLELSKDCRNSTLNSWKIDLDKLKK